MGLNTSVINAGLRSTKRGSESVLRIFETPPLRILRAEHSARARPAPSSEGNCSGGAVSFEMRQEGAETCHKPKLIPIRATSSPLVKAGFE